MGKLFRALKKIFIFLLPSISVVIGDKKVSDDSGQT
jgi:hypothetical protein